MTAIQVTQHEWGRLVSASWSLLQQHRQIKYTMRKRRLRPRHTAATKPRKSSDWKERGDSQQLCP